MTYQNPTNYQASFNNVLLLAISVKKADFLNELQLSTSIYCQGITELLMQYIDAVYVFDPDISQQQYIDSADQKVNAYKVFVPLDDFIHGLDQYYFDMSRSSSTFTGSSIFMTPSFRKRQIPLIREAVKRLYPNLSNSYKDLVGINYISEKAVIEKGKYQAPISMLNGFILAYEIDDNGC